MDFAELSFVTFGALSPDAIRKLSVVEVTNPNTKESNLDNSPYDERMGVINNGTLCQTCGKNNMECQGHFGHIELPFPVFNPKYMEFVYKIFKCICVSCGEPRKKAGHLEILRLSSDPIKRFASLVTLLSKINECPSCGEPIPDFKFDKPNLQILVGNKKEFKKLSSTLAYQYLSLINPETMKALGFNLSLYNSEKYKDHRYTHADLSHAHEVHPTSFMFTAFPVIPICARPWIIRDGDICHDDITDKYCSILRIIKKLAGEYTQTKRKTQKKSTETDKKKLMADLEGHVYTLIDNKNDVSKISSCGRGHKGIRERIESKEGHINSNVGGKRVDFSARTVIVSGAGLDVGEVGVPEMIANKMTVPEHVTNFNQEHIEKLIRQKKATMLIRNGKRIRLDIVTKNYTRDFPVKIGDIVERKVQDGDYCLFNRQPSLRTESMMGKRIRVMRDGGNAFRLPLAACTAFNADFDGDEMNLHLPQSIPAIVECATIMATENHLVTAQRNGPVCGVIQDGLVGSFLLTAFDIEVPKGVFFDCVFASKIDLDIHDFFGRVQRFYGVDYSKRDSVPGKVFMSAIFPPDFVYKRRTDFAKGREMVKIYEGIILPTSAPLCKKTIGAKQRSIVHDLWKEYSPSMCAKVISRIQQMIDNWLHTHGFSIGISDCISTGHKKIEDILTKSEAVCDNIIHSKISDAEKENEINKTLNSAMNEGPVIANHTMNKGDQNAITIMRNSGAKGNNTNCVQIAAFIGQQNIDGGRVDLDIPCFKNDDISPAAKGFVSHSYMDGLTPHEVFYHAASGRRGVVDTAMKTSDSGYIEKKIMKKVEDFLCMADGSVRNSIGDIIQFKYGDDGLNPKHLYSVSGVKFPFFVDVESIARRLNIGEKGEKRTLYPEEIDLMLTFIKTSNMGKETEIDSNNRDIFTRQLKNGLEKVKIAKTKIAKFCVAIRDSFERSRIAYNEPVGVICAQSLGEPTTQLTLNTFHFTGLADMDVTLGVPRLKELLLGTTNPSTPSCKIYFNDDRLNGDEEEDVDARREVIDILYEHIANVEEVTVNKMNGEFEIIKFSEYMRRDWEDAFDEYLEVEEVGSRYVIVAKFDINKLYQYRVSLEDIADKLEEETEGCLVCKYSGIMDAEMVVFIDFEKIQNLGNIELVGTEDEKVTKNVVVDFIKSVRIKGIEGVSKVVPDQDNDGVWRLHMEGSKLIEALNVMDVDTEKTFTNDFWEVYNVFGIEAARAFLIEEFGNVLGFGGTYINPRHITILVDAMTRTGTITSVTQYGINRDVGPIAKGMFEKCTENFAISSMFGETDTMQGAAANIMFGKLVKNGVGGVEVF